MQTKRLRSKLVLIATCLWIMILSLLYSFVHLKLEKEQEPLLQLQNEYHTTLTREEARHEKLKEEIESLSDPAAGEKALIEELGVVPSGMKKIVYNADSNQGHE